jgi:hypothetical protein
MAQENNPYQSFVDPATVPEAGKRGASPLGSLSEQTRKLGSLAQVIRSKQLLRARRTLIFAGILIAAMNGYYFATIEHQVDRHLRRDWNAAQQPADPQNPQAWQEFRAKQIFFAQIVQAAGIVLGAAIILLGLAVKNYPLPSTIAGLVFYFAGNAILEYFNPISLVWGIACKIVVLAVMLRSIVAATAYQRERAAEERLTQVYLA